MKNYETGICANCKGTMEMHNSNNPCLHFKDSGLAQLEKNAPKLLEALEKIASSHPDGNPMNLISIAQEAINEALKRE